MATPGLFIATGCTKSMNRNGRIMPCQQVSAYEWCYQHKASGKVSYRSSQVVRHLMFMRTVHLHMPFDNLKLAAGS